MTSSICFATIAFVLASVYYADSILLPECFNVEANVQYTQAATLTAVNSNGYPLAVQGCDCSTNFGSLCGDNAQTAAIAAFTSFALTSDPPTTFYCTPVQGKLCEGQADVPKKLLCFGTSEQCSTSNVLDYIESGTLQTCTFQRAARCCAKIGCVPNPTNGTAGR